ncbi:uncharacterized protein ACIBXB_006502 isoform 1-T1 [Morphnus guianensis]
MCGHPTLCAPFSLPRNIAEHGFLFSKLGHKQPELKNDESSLGFCMMLVLSISTGSMQTNTVLTELAAGKPTLYLIMLHENTSEEFTRLKEHHVTSLWVCRWKCWVI